ncbi:hypothetical protein [Paraclostridium sordellii]|uniref:hypothetical protein n=1 Tax=Paraclostridium sordellii TaxID=1505 RepID=UPI0005E30FB4|nr:hypothetical protein [Paeniclostridium sordellii]CEO23399.1 Uncharacterised protein [[Clostridium] sordellii] [Paeniclostridium sordellii]
MKKISGLLLIVVMIVLLVGCGDKHETKNDNKNTEKSKYEIDNSESISMTDKDFEKFYNRSKEAALESINTLGKNDYLGPEKSVMVVFENNGITFLLHAVDKPDVDDNTVVVFYPYDSKQKKHIKGPIQYNHHLYKDM